MMVHYPLLCVALQALLSTGLVTGYRLAPRLGTKKRKNVIDVHRDTSSSALKASPDDDQAGLSLKTLAIGVVGGLGVFGAGFIGTLQGIGKDIAFEQRAQQQGVITKVKSSSNRGSKTRLSRREINTKLAQIPLFYVSNGLGGVYTDGAGGQFFETKAQAEAYAKTLGGDRKVEAATMDEVYFSLMKKKAKLSVSGRIAANSDPEAIYSLVGEKGEVDKAGQTWLEKHPNDIPLYRVPTMAFEKENGLELPLFTERDSAKAAYERLKEDRAAKQPATGAPAAEAKVLAPDEFQTLSVLDVIELWNTGGSESRALELYPSMIEIDNYKAMR